MDRFEWQDTLTFDEPASGLEAIDLSNFNGDVTLTGTDSEAVQIVAVRRVRATDEALGRAYFEALAPAIAREAGTLIVRTPKPEPKAWPYITHASVNYQVTLPARLAVRARTDNGALSAAGFARDVDVAARNGRVRVADVAGNANAVTYNGSVVLERVGSATQATSYNGAVRVDVRRAPAEATFKTYNGSIDVTLAEAPTAPVKASTLNGSIALNVPPGAAFDLDARTTHGAIHTDWGDARGKWGLMAAMQTPVNGGGAPVELHATNGGIRVRQSRPAGWAPAESGIEVAAAVEAE